MLLAENRLKKVRDFNLLMKYGYWKKGQFLDIKTLELAKIENYFPLKEDKKEFKKQLKLAIVAGLKVSKSAVKRNRFRRQVSEAVRLLLKNKKTRNGFYVLIVVKSDILKKNYAEISQEVELLFRQAKLMD